MPVQLDTTDRDFDSAFATFLASKRETSEDVDAAVREIIAHVRRDGDAALMALTEKFDRLDLAKVGVRVSEAEIATAVSACDAATLDALRLARDRIETHHRRQLPRDDSYTDALGAVPWLRLMNIVARPTNRDETVFDAGFTTNRYYRVVTPYRP